MEVDFLKGNDKKYVIILSYNEVKQIKEYVLNNSICFIKILYIKNKKITFMISNLKRYGYEMDMRMFLVQAYLLMVLMQ